MKNFLKSISLFSLIFTLFYCTNAANPKPTSRLNQSNSNENFIWQPVKMVTISFGKGLKLGYPCSVTDSAYADINWVSEDGCFTALQPSKVTFFSLGNVDIDTITTKYLNNLKFNSYNISATPVSSLSYPNNLPVNTVIACKKQTGEYFLLKITKVNWGMYSNVQFSVYHRMNEIV